MSDWTQENKIKIKVVKTLKFKKMDVNESIIRLDGTNTPPCNRHTT